MKVGKLVVGQIMIFVENENTLNLDIHEDKIVELPL